MADSDRSLFVTVLLCAGFVVANYWVQTHGYGILNYLALWPFYFIVMVMIAARIWHGHDRP